MSGTACKYCGGAILWAVTEKDKRMPLDPWIDPEGNAATRIVAGTLLVRILHAGEEPRPGEKRRIPHVATCPEWDPGAARDPTPRRRRPPPDEQPTLEGM